MSQRKKYWNQSLSEVKSRYKYTGEEMILVKPQLSLTNEQISNLEYVLENWIYIFNLKKNLKLDMGYFNDGLKHNDHVFSNNADYGKYKKLETKCACFLGHLLYDQNIFKFIKIDLTKNFYLNLVSLSTKIFGEHSYNWLFETFWENSKPCSYHRLAFYYANEGASPKISTHKTSNYLKFITMSDDLTLIPNFL